MNIKSLFTGNKKQFIYYIIGVLIITPSNIMVTFGIANAFSLFEASSTGENLNIILISLVLSFSPIILQVISRYLRIGFMRDVLVQVRMLSYKKLLSKSPNDFKKKSMESYQSQLVSDINLFEADFFLSILNVIYAFGNFILGIIVLVFISPLLALSTIFTAIFLFVLTKIFQKPTIERKERVLRANSKFHESLTNILRGLETIKLYQVVDKFKATFYKDIVELERDKKSSYQITLVQKNIMSWISGSFQVFTIIYAAYLFSLDRIALSSLVVVFNLIGQLIWGMNNGFSMMNRFKTAIEIFNNITQYKEPEVLRGRFSLDSKIIAKDLDYSYDGKEVLKDVNIRIKNKDKVLIFGESGTGKTTFVNTLTKNLDDYEGEIFYDDVNLKDINLQSFASNVGYVRQEHFIFDDSIKNNIILDKAFDEDKFTRILKEAALYGWVNTLDLKENHELIDNGSNISGGQRQRINIARELYQGKDLIIFDEPSSSLDDYTSSKIYDTIQNLNKTVIVISHRHIGYLSERFDQVIDLSKEGGLKNV